MSGPVGLRASSRSVRAEALTSDDVVVDASSGHVELQFATPPRRVLVDASSGDVVVALPGGPYAVDAETSSGDEQVDVPVDPASARAVRARASSGDVDVVTVGP